jgi:hypothetical protein
MKGAKKEAVSASGAAETAGRRFFTLDYGVTVEEPNDDETGSNISPFLRYA